VLPRDVSQICDVSVGCVRGETTSASRTLAGEGLRGVRWQGAAALRGKDYRPERFRNAASSTGVELSLKGTGKFPAQGYS
jgi:hypothetical protein